MLNIIKKESQTPEMRPIKMELNITKKETPTPATRPVKIKLNVTKKETQTPTKRPIKIILNCSPKAIEKNNLSLRERYPIIKLVTKYSTNFIYADMSPPTGYKWKHHASGEPIKMVIKRTSRATNTSSNSITLPHQIAKPHAPGEPIMLVFNLPSRAASNRNSDSITPPRALPKLHAPGEPIKLVFNLPSRAASNRNSNSITPPRALPKLHAPGEPIKLVFNLPSRAASNRNSNSITPPRALPKLHAPGETIKLIIKDPTFHRRQLELLKAKPHTRNTINKLAEKQGGQWLFATISDPEMLFREPRAQKAQLPRPYEGISDDEDLDDIPELDLGEPEYEIKAGFSATGHIEKGNMIWSCEEYEALAPEREKERQRRMKKLRARGVGKTGRVRKWINEGHEYNQRDESGRWIAR